MSSRRGFALGFRSILDFWSAMRKLANARIRFSALAFFPRGRRDDCRRLRATRLRAQIVIWSRPALVPIARASSTSILFGAAGVREELLPRCQ